MDSSQGDPTIVEYFAEHEHYRCGYCGCADTNYSHGMWAHQMTVQDYQDLIDRGWRRSGKYCYKPTMKMTCCPQYTIRCDATAFKLNKSHKKAIKKVNKFLITGQRPGQEKRSSGDGETMGEGESFMPGGAKGMEAILAEKAKPSLIEKPKQLKAPSDTGEGTSSAAEKMETSKSLPISTPSQSTTQASSHNFSEGESQKHIPKPGAGADPNKPQCRKAKAIRAERKLQKQQAKGTDGQVPEKQKKQNQEKSIEDFLSEPDHALNPAHKLELRLVRSCPRSDQFSSSFQAAHKVYHKYQTTIHKDKPDKPNQKQYTRFLCDSPLGVKEDVHSVKKAEYAKRRRTLS